MGPRSAAALPANGQAQLLRVEDAGRAPRAEVLHERLGHLARQRLLDDEPMGEAVDELGERAEPDHPAPGDVGHVRHAAVREEVVRAHGVEVDAAHRHEVPPALGHAAREHLAGSRP